MGETYLLEHILAELKLLRHALAAVLQVHAEQRLIAQLLLCRGQTSIQLWNQNKASSEDAYVYFGFIM